MWRNLLIFVLMAVLFWFAADYLSAPTPAGAPATRAARPPLDAIVPPQRRAPLRRYADISVHSEEALALLFDRVEALLDHPRSKGEQPVISLVLHGPEVEFFALKNYDRYKDLVDRAARLAAFGAVDISICQTQMRVRGIGSDEVPAFLRQVPYGPDEVERLRREGYVAM